MGDDIPQWAWERAEALGSAENGSGYWSPNRNYPSVIALARYISEHEEPPVDPLLIEARRLVARDIEDSGAHVTHFTSDGLSAEVPAGEALMEIRAGLRDDTHLIQRTLAAIKRGMELAGDR